MENVMFFFADFPVYSYGFMLGLGLLLGSLLAQKEGKRKGISSEFVFRFILNAVIVFVFAGRFFSVYRVYGWRTVIYPWILFSGVQLDEIRAFIAVVIYAAYFLVRKVEKPAMFLDAFMPTVALMQSLAYLGSSILGRETTRMWGVDSGGFMLHPLPLYFALAYYLIFSILWRFRRNLRYDGQLSLTYLTLSALAQRILMPYQEVFGESTNPWLYTIAFILFGSTCFYIHMKTPFPDLRRRPNLLDWRTWIMYLVSVLVVGLIMVKFFYWRFS